MLCRCLLGVLVVALVLAAPTAGRSGELLRILRARWHGLAHQPGGLQPVPVGQPGHWYPHYIPDQPRGPVPAFNWGYFGARQVGASFSTHVGYYDDYYQWGTRRSF